MPAAGRGRRHLSLDGPATAVDPGPGPRGVSGAAGTARAPGPEVGAGLSPPPPRPEPSVGAAALPKERPSRALCPAAPDSGAHRLRPSPQLPRLGRTEQRGRAATTASGAPERSPARRPALRVLTGPPQPPARPSSPSSPRRRCSAAPGAAALGVGTALGQVSWGRDGLAPGGDRTAAPRAGAEH